MLTVFEAVARHLNFTRAAEELHLTQPAVSMQIKQLEGSVGLPLFEHIGKKVYLTDAGREVHQYAHAIGKLLADMEYGIAALKGVSSGKLDIAVTSTANYFGTRLLAAFSRRYGEFRYRLSVTNRQTLLTQLENNEIDLAIMGRPPQGLDLMAEPFMENPLVVIAPPDHHMVGQTAIALERLKSQLFVVREQGSGTRIATEKFFESQGITLNSRMELTSNEAIKQAVQAGLGLGIVSEHTLELELALKRVAILDVEGFPVLRHWYVVFRPGKRLLPLAQAFKEFVIKEAQSVLISLRS
jgi:DNA-binding transcriptional LysR family regulator